MVRRSALSMLALSVPAMALTFSGPGIEAAFAADDGPGFYVRAGVGLERSTDATFSDRNCASVSPPALFGCVEGPGGQSIGGRGDFGQSIAVEGAIGFRPLSTLRLEAVLAHRPSFAFSGNANFLGIQGRQPVDGDASTTSAMVFGYLDIAPMLEADLGRF